MSDNGSDHNTSTAPLVMKDARQSSNHQSLTGIRTDLEAETSTARDLHDLFNLAALVRFGMLVVRLV
jgi:hypothetical protein